MSARSGRCLVVVAGVVLAAGAPSPAAAIDKQGSAHGGDTAGADRGFDLSGALTLGGSIYNVSYAARPDNTGLALMRYAAHVDADLIGRRLSIPIDVNLFTDRKRDGLQRLAPTEFDVIGGVTSTWALGPGALEAGTRVEHDRPIDQGSFTQTYLDARARYLYSAAPSAPRLASALRDGDVSGWATLGWFAVNPSYAARPDNSGIALLRYGLHVELSTFSDLLSVGLDGTMFTDRHESALRPSELDLTPEVILHRGPLELHVAYERDMTLDGLGGKPGYVQQFVYALAVWSFDLVKPKPSPLRERGQILSP